MYTTNVRQLFVRTDKKFIPSLPRYAFDGKIYVVQSENEAERAVEVLKKSPILGIDTETRPTFRKGESHKVALLQVANEQMCFLFRMNEIGFLPCMANLLASPDVLKVGLSLKDDFLMLRRRNSDFKPGGYIDLQDYVKQMGIQDMSLQKLYANVFHKRISKKCPTFKLGGRCVDGIAKGICCNRCLHLHSTVQGIKATESHK